MSTFTLTVLIDEEIRTIDVEQGANLRRTLLANDISPYAPLMQKLNCGGRGICATCGVWIVDDAPRPQHWHDWAAATFGYPRLSCQISIDDDMTIRILTEKVFWGRRDPATRWRFGDATDDQEVPPPQ